MDEYGIDSQTHLKLILNAINALKIRGIDAELAKMLGSLIRVIPKCMENTRTN